MGGEVAAGNLKAGASGTESLRRASWAPGPRVVGTVFATAFRRGLFGTDEFGGKDEPISGEGCGGIRESSGARRSQ